mgnify:CR=1 FL=1
MSEPNRIREMADKAAASIERLKGELANCRDAERRKYLREKIKGLRQVERWMRTRRGYA